MPDDKQRTYERPTVTDYGTLVDITAASQIIGSEDAGAKLSILDVSDGMLP